MREARVFLREKERIVSILISPLLFLFVMGKGMVSGNSRWRILTSSSSSRA